jgi:hypothetical protein
MRDSGVSNAKAIYWGNTPSTLCHHSIHTGPSDTPRDLERQRLNFVEFESASQQDSEGSFVGFRGERHLRLIAIAAHKSDRLNARLAQTFVRPEYDAAQARQTTCEDDVNH